MRALLPIALAAAAALLGADARADERPNRIAFGGGVPHLQIREDLTRRFRWDGLGGLVALGYEHRGPSVRHVAGLELPASWITNRYGAGAAAISLRLDYSLLFAAGDAWGGRFWIGGRWRWDHAAQYYVDWDEEHLYWLVAHELGPVALWETAMAQGHLLQLSLSTPVVALASRPPTERTNKVDDLKSVGFYFGRPHRGMSLVTLPTYVSAEGRIAWHWSLSESWLLQTAWEVRLRRHAEPRPVKILENALVGTLAHDF